MLETVIRFIYTSEIDGELSFDDFKVFYRTLKHFAVFDFHWDVLNEELDYIEDTSNILEIISLIQNDVGARTIIIRLVKGAAKTFRTVLQEKSFLTTSVDVLKLIFRESDLSIDSEMGVFKAIIKWINYDYATRSQYFPRLLKLVRYDRKGESSTQVSTFTSWLH